VVECRHSLTGGGLADDSGKEDYHSAKSALIPVLQWHFAADLFTLYFSVLDFVTRSDQNQTSVSDQATRPATRDPRPATRDQAVAPYFLPFSKLALSRGR
jgi:hypothetical protein